MSRLRVAIWCAYALMISHVAAQARDLPASQPGPATGPSAIRTSQYIGVRDGTRLAVNIYRPARDGVLLPGRFPVVFAFTPYRARYFDKGKVVELVDSPQFGLRRLVESGYVVMTADIRGKGASFGSRRGFLDQTEARDGYDLIQWVAGQPYADGKVGMTGCSYLGGAAMLVAGTLPPALSAVFAAASDIDKYSFVRSGGITAQFNTRPDEPLEIDGASVPVDGDADGMLLRQAVAQHAGNTPMAPLWYGMPYRDSISALTGNRFWEEVGPYTHLKALTDPQLTWYFWGNWSDEPTEQMILAAANIKSRLVIGPGSHCAPPSQFDITDIQKRFFDHVLKGMDNGFDREPRYSWWREGAGESGTLVHSDRLPGIGIRRMPLFLASGGVLGPRPGSDGRTSFTVDYDVGGKDYFAFWPPVMDDKGLTYTSPPIAEDAVFEGYPIARVTAALDREDGDLFTYLEDVAPDGKVTVVSFGRLKASHRKLSPAPYDRLDLPYHSGLRADVMPMIPGKPASFAMSMSPRAYTFAAGHRVRFTIAGADPRQRNLAEIRQTPPPVFTVLSGKAAGSRVEIPFLRQPKFR